MRQTNIFWVGVFLAGTEWVRTCTDMVAKVPTRGGQGKDASLLERALGPYTRGELHDPSIEEAGPLGKSTYYPQRENDANEADFLYCLISIGVSAVSHPIIVISRLWPQIALLLTFGAFVVWNGGVVLGTLPTPLPTPSLTEVGDKSNHVATLHLTQMLYLWPFIAFFSFPLFLPTIISAPPQSQHSRLGLHCYRPQPGHRPFQHAHSSFYPRRQSALHVLRLPVHDTAAPANKICTCTNIRPLRVVRATCAL
jgi:alpha-1,2-glucosyltransferase